MSFERFLEELLRIYFECFQFDIFVFSTKIWMYKWLCIPAFFYVIFFFFKWIVILFPLYIIPSWILQCIAKVIYALRVPKRRSDNG
jgi:hypothetical protein